MVGIERPLRLRRRPGQLLRKQAARGECQRRCADAEAVAREEMATRHRQPVLVHQIHKSQLELFYPGLDGFEAHSVAIGHGDCRISYRDGHKQSHQQTKKTGNIEQ